MTSAPISARSRAEILPADKIGILEMAEEVHHPDVVDVLVHFISPF